MSHICDQCRYVFSADALPEQCPDYGELAVRMAMEDESAEHQHLLTVVAEDNWDDTAERVGVQRLTSSR